MAKDDDIAKALLRSVVETLDLCAPCKDRLLEKDGLTVSPPDSEFDTESLNAEPYTVPPATYHEFDIECPHSTTKMARFTKSTLQTAIVNSSTCTNVSFTICKLTNVVVKNAVLRNAHFHNVDFDKVTFRDIELEDVEMSDQFLEHAVLTQDSYEIRAS